MKETIKLALYILRFFLIGLLISRIILLFFEISQYINIDGTEYIIISKNILLDTKVIVILTISILSITALEAIIGKYYSYYYLSFNFFDGKKNGVASIYRRSKDEIFNIKDFENSMKEKYGTVFIKSKIKISSKEFQEAKNKI